MEGTVTSTFGKRMNPVLKTGEFHDGIDIFNNTGTEVLAVHSGIVKEVKYSETYGNVLIYKITGENINSEVDVFYAHLDKILVSVGDKVKEGEVVAKSGDTGLVTGPHLHYTILIDNKTINPIYYVDLPITDEVAIEIKGN